MFSLYIGCAAQSADQYFLSLRGLEKYLMMKNMNIAQKNCGGWVNEDGSPCSSNIPMDSSIHAMNVTKRCFGVLTLWVPMLGDGNEHCTHDE